MTRASWDGCMMDEWLVFHVEQGHSSKLLSGHEKVDHTRAERPTYVAHRFLLKVGRRTGKGNCNSVVRVLNFHLVVSPSFLFDRYQPRTVQQVAVSSEYKMFPHNPKSIRYKPQTCRAEMSRIEARPRRDRCYDRVNRWRWTTTTGEKRSRLKTPRSREWIRLSGWVRRQCVIAHA